MTFFSEGEGGFHLLTEAHIQTLLGSWGLRERFGTLLWSLPHKYFSKHVVCAAGSPGDTIHIVFCVNGAPLERIQFGWCLLKMYSESALQGKKCPYLKVRNNQKGNSTDLYKIRDKRKPIGKMIGR